MSLTLHNKIIIYLLHSIHTHPLVQVRSWIGVITLILACTMNEGAIDSLQNGIAAVFTQHFFKGQHTIFPRMVLVAINIPLIIVSLQGELRCCGAWGGGMTVA